MRDSDAKSDDALRDPLAAALDTLDWGNVQVAGGRSDWLADVSVLVKLFGDINKAFGLTPEQLERLSPNKRVYAYKAISAAGGFMVGRVVTRELVIRTLKLVGVRLSAQQAAKFVPIAGQAVSAALTFSALKLVCEPHIRQCIEVAQVLQRLPTPEAQAASETASPVLRAG